MKSVRKALIPVTAFLILAANTASQAQLHDNLWPAWVGAALIVLAGLVSVGKRWMYFVFPLGVAALLFLCGLYYNYREAANYLGHWPEGSELAAFLNVRWQREYGADGPYWLTVDIVYFVSSYVAGWLYGAWSMLVPGGVKPTVQVASAPGVIKGRKPFRIVLWVLVAVWLIVMLLGRSR